MTKDVTKNLYLMTPADIKRLRKLVRVLEKAIAELVELKRITTFDDQRNYHPPFESDLIEEQSFIEYQLELTPKPDDRNNF